MKRREFLGAPSALLGLGLVGGFSNAAQAAEAPAFLLLRLAGSGGEAEITGAWQDAWPQAVPDLQRARIVFRGIVPATVSTLGAVDVESVFFGNTRSVNMALVYASSDAGETSSKAISFYATAPSFGGLVVTPGGTKRKSGVPASISLGDSRNGLLTTGHYVLLHTTVKRLNPADYVWSGYDDRPLRRRNGRAVETDYLVFEVGPV